MIRVSRGVVTKRQGVLSDVVDKLNGDDIVKLGGCAVKVVLVCVDKLDLN